jgi:hypothetical protein
MTAPGGRRLCGVIPRCQGSSRPLHRVRHHIVGFLPWDHQYFVYTRPAAGPVRFNRRKSCFFIDKFHD